ncbi:MAG: carbonic anhydrase [Fimbriimonas sp.]
MSSRILFVFGGILLTALAVTQAVQQQQSGDKLNDLISKHPTLEEVSKIVKSKVKTPGEALELLKFGNIDFYSAGGPSSRVSPYERRLQMLGQTPFATILSCSDSRVPPEIVFDQGPGDLFVVRIAGNAADPGTLGSVEYAIDHLKTKLIVVMGHEECGAIKAAMLPMADQEKEAANIQHVLSLVRPALEGMASIKDGRAKMREAIVSNVRYQVAQLLKDPVVAAGVAKGEVQVVGAVYEIGSGAVEFF